MNLVDRIMPRTMEVADKEQEFLIKFWYHLLIADHISRWHSQENVHVDLFSFHVSSLKSLSGKIFQMNVSEIIKVKNHIPKYILLLGQPYFLTLPVLSYTKACPTRKSLQNT